MDSYRKRLFIVIAIIVATIGIVVTLALVFGGGNNSTNDPLADQREYVDPDSGETVLDPEGKTPEGLVDNGLFLGFSKLLDMGLTSAQYSQVQTDLQSYVDTKKLDGKEITQISLIVATISPFIDSESGTKIINADIRINKTVAQSFSVDYSGFFGTTVTIKNKETGEVLFVNSQTQYDNGESTPEE
jgi:hypothetical protein